MSVIHYLLLIGLRLMVTRYFNYYVSVFRSVVVRYPYMKKLMKRVSLILPPLIKHYFIQLNIAYQMVAVQ